MLLAASPVMTDPAPAVAGSKRKLGGGGRRQVWHGGVCNFDRQVRRRPTREMYESLRGAISRASVAPKRSPSKIAAETYRSVLVKITAVGNDLHCPRRYQAVAAGTGRSSCAKMLVRSASA